MVVRFFAFCAQTVHISKICNNIRVANFEHFSVLKIIFTINFYFSKFLLVFTFSCSLFSRTFLLSLSLSSLIGLSCFRKVKWKMQFILCFLKSASKSLRSQSLNFPLKSCYCHQNFISLLSIVCLCFQELISLVIVLIL